MNLRILAAFALCLAPACGSSNPAELTDQGSKALNSGDYEGAAKSYEKALTVLGSDTSNPEWLRAKLGSVKAHAHTDATKAKSDFLALAAASPSKVTDREYSAVAGALGEAKHFKEAIEVLEAGMKSNPESVALKGLRDDLGKRAESSGDSGALDALKGLGYGGK